ncbi:MAG: hypothetical protein C4527_00365 [Candidatus Omnitrophota bacterium]|jgi:hypothetical protein|nr:MAG: hypothetical protein C4527_00365 [Candidatus Omnitrophota bacterium]
MVKFHLRSITKTDQENDKLSDFNTSLSVFSRKTAFSVLRKGGAAAGNTNVRKWGFSENEEKNA